MFPDEEDEPPISQRVTHRPPGFDAEETPLVDPKELEKLRESIEKETSPKTGTRKKSGTK